MKMCFSSKFGGKKKLLKRFTQIAVELWFLLFQLQVKSDQAVRKIWGQSHLGPITGAVVSLKKERKSPHSLSGQAGTRVRCTVKGETGYCEHNGGEGELHIKSRTWREFETLSVEPYPSCVVDPKYSADDVLLQIGGDELHLDGPVAVNSIFWPVLWTQLTKIHTKTHIKTQIQRSFRLINNKISMILNPNLCSNNKL